MLPRSSATSPASHSSFPRRKTADSPPDAHGPAPRTSQLRMHRAVEKAQRHLVVESAGGAAVRSIGRHSAVGGRVGAQPRHLDDEGRSAGAVNLGWRGIGALGVGAQACVAEWAARFGCAPSKTRISRVAAAATDVILLGWRRPCRHGGAGACQGSSTRGQYAEAVRGGSTWGQYAGAVRGSSTSTASESQHAHGGGQSRLLVAQAGGVEA